MVALRQQHNAAVSAASTGARIARRHRLTTRWLIAARGARISIASSITRQHRASAYRGSAYDAQHRVTVNITRASKYRRHARNKRGINITPRFGSQHIRVKHRARAAARASASMVSYRCVVRAHVGEGSQA